MVSKVVYNVIQYSFFLKKKNKRKRHKKIVVRHSGSTIASKAKMKGFFSKKHCFISYTFNTNFKKPLTYATVFS